MLGDERAKVGKPTEKKFPWTLLSALQWHGKSEHQGVDQTQPPFLPGMELSSSTKQDTECFPGAQHFSKQREPE